MICQNDLDLLFPKAKTHRHWLNKKIPMDVLKQLHEMVYAGPTSVNSCPLRVAYIQSQEAKEKLCECVISGNISSIMAAPVTAILSMDAEFYEKLPHLFPHLDVKDWYKENEDVKNDTMVRNSTLQCGCFIIAARALGLDCGPMQGLDPEKINSIFLKDTTWKVNFICALGYGDYSKVHANKDPRPSFEETTLFL